MDPIIGGLLAKGLSLIANVALAKGKDWVKDKTGVDLAKANLSQEDYVKLREFEFKNEELLMKFRENNNKLDAEMEMAYLKDRDSARQMQIAALNQNDVFSKRFIYYFAVLWSVGAICFVIALFVTEVPKDNVRMIDNFQGFLFGTIIPAILFYFYGSSRGSQNKDKTISDLVKEK